MTISTQSMLAMPLRLPALPARLARILWFGRSIRAQLLLVFVLIDIVAVLAAGGVAILRARTQTRVEMASSMRLAELLVGDAGVLARRERSAEQFLAALPAQLQSMRHVRFAVRDAAGVVIAATLPDASANRPTD